MYLYILTDSFNHIIYKYKKLLLELSTYLVFGGLND